MPNRMLRDWTDSQKFDGISAESERLFVRLIMKSDDFGRYYGDTRLIRAHVFPLLDNLRANDLDRWLDDLSHRQLILRYESKGRKYLSIVNYGQRLRQSRAKFPPPEGESEEWLPSDSNFPRLPATSGDFPPEEKRSRREVEAEAEGLPPPQLNEFELAAMSKEAALADLERHYPDLDVMGEYRKLKARCDKEGSSPTWRGLLGWLKKASPKVKLKRGDALSKVIPIENGQAPIPEHEQKQMAQELAEMRRTAGV